MPHNRTRFWVGVAIVAVTIPAVGTFYNAYTAPREDSDARPLVAGMRNVDSPPAAPILASTVPQRDYMGEVNAALGRQGAASASSVPAEPVYNDDEFFDTNPLDNVYADTPPDPTDAQSPPDPTANLAPGEALAVTQDGPVTGTDLQTAQESASTDDQPAPADLTYAQVYRLVVDNLAPDDRQEFLRAYATMSPDERADLLDGFRAQIQNGG